VIAEFVGVSWKNEVGDDSYDFGRRIWVCRPLVVVTSGSARLSVALFCSRA